MNEKKESFQENQEIKQFEERLSDVNVHNSMNRDAQMYNQSSKYNFGSARRDDGVSGKLSSSETEKSKAPVVSDVNNKHNNGPYTTNNNGMNIGSSNYPGSGNPIQNINSNEDNPVENINSNPAGNNINNGQENIGQRTEPYNNGLQPQAAISDFGKNLNNFKPNNPYDQKKLPEKKNNNQNKAQIEAMKKAAYALHPALGKIANSKVGEKVINNILNSKKSNFKSFGLNPFSPNSDKEKSDKKKSTFGSVTADVKTIKIVFAISGALCACFVFGILIFGVAGVGYGRVLNLGFADNVSLDDENVENYINKNASQMGNDDFDPNIFEEAYYVPQQDIYTDQINNDSINVFLVAKNEVNLEDLSDYYSTKVSCINKLKCTRGNEYKFFLKMYDIYYLYKNKYNVQLDLPLIMSTLIYKEVDVNEVVNMNLSDYDRKLIVESNWNPKEITSLDWEYDYESKENYLVENDASMDMQVLAKNMVRKSVVQKCVSNGKTVNSKEVKDNEADLKCNAGEELEYGTATYKLDLNKYDEFLNEYIEKKYYLNRKVANPVVSSGPDYINNKTTSTSNNYKTTSTSSNNKSSTSATKVKMTGGFKKTIYYYNQYNYNDSPYSVYGSIGSHGCGPTSLAIAVSSILQEEHDPIEFTNYVCSIGGCTSSGSAYLVIYQAAKDYGQKYGFTAEPTSNLDLVKQRLSEGNSVVITITNGGFYTNSGNLISRGGHYFVLTGVDENGQVYLSDPSNANNTGRTINLEALAVNNNNRPDAPSFCILTK